MSGPNQPRNGARALAELGAGPFRLPVRLSAKASPAESRGSRPADFPPPQAGADAGDTADAAKPPGLPLETSSVFEPKTRGTEHLVSVAAEAGTDSTPPGEVSAKAALPPSPQLVLDPAQPAATPVDASLASKPQQQGALAPVAFGVRLTPAAGVSASSTGRQPEALPTGSPSGTPETAAASSVVAADTRHPVSWDIRVAGSASLGPEGDTDRRRVRPAEPVEGVGPLPETSRAAGLPLVDIGRDSAAPAARPQADPLPPAAPDGPPPAAPSAPPSASAHEIHLQVQGAEDRRVDVRVTQKAGAVEVAVRTPDSRLAGALREDLPELSARLEQSGFRAEAWQPAAAAERHPQMLETRFTDTGPNSQPGHGQAGHPQHQGQESPRRHPAPPAQSGSDPDRKGFSWILSSFR